jgi:hypothetical protein
MVSIDCYMIPPIWSSSCIANLTTTRSVPKRELFWARELRSDENVESAQETIMG